ncbi:MAG: hypothetical protein HRT68_12940 [Flavobacteriaceae bacterium]|nr:hypothetical protein [Flavobacteriaceae bacterium]
MFLIDYNDKTAVFRKKPGKTLFIIALIIITISLIAIVGFKSYLFGILILVFIPFMNLSKFIDALSNYSRVEIDLINQSLLLRKRLLFLTISKKQFNSISAQDFEIKYGRVSKRSNGYLLYFNDSLKERLIWIFNEKEKNEFEKLLTNKVNPE